MYILLFMVSIIDLISIRIDRLYRIIGAIIEIIERR